MGKKILFVAFFVCVVQSMSFALNYWYMDYNIQGTMRRVYFFKDIKSFEEATGREVGSLLNWVQIIESLTPVHTRAIFDQMIYEGFVAAFYAFDPWYDPNHGRTMYEYTFYLLPSGPYGTKYTFMPYLSTPINFPSNQR
jgi:hypothetical protein